VEGFDGHGDGLGADAFAEAEHESEEEGEDDPGGQGGFVTAGDEGAADAAAEGGEEPGHAQPERLHGRGVLDIGHMEADAFKDLLDVGAFGQAEGFLGELAEHGDIDDAGEAAFGGDDGEGEEFVQDEHFTGFEDGGGFGDGDDAVDHDVLEAGRGGSEQEPAGGEDADEPLVVVNDIEIDDLLGGALFPDAGERAGDGKVLGEGGEIAAGDAAHGLVEVFRCHGRKVMEAWAGKQRGIAGREGGQGGDRGRPGQKPLKLLKLLNPFAIVPI